jgi:IMP dehydrogenase
MQFRECLTYSDVLLSPKYSEISSRSNVDTSVVLKNSKGKEFIFKHPMIPANMSNVTELAMARELYLSGGMSLFHRFASPSVQLEWLDEIKSWGDDAVNYIGFSIGVKQSDYEMVDSFVSSGARIIVIDVAHGHSLDCIKMTKYISEKYPDVLLISGNVATASGARDLWNAGANVVKCGIGAGGICLTRIEAAAGVPQLTAIMDVAQEQKHHKDKYLIADGGIAKVADIVKACCFADMCMAGNMFAGTNEAPGETMEIDGVIYKKYAGSSTHKKDHVEGVIGWVPTKGSVKDALKKMMQGLKSGCSYQGADNLLKLKQDPHFVKITQAGFIESGAHDVVVIK